MLLCIDSPISVGGTEFQVNKFAEYLTQFGLQPLVVILGSVREKKKHLFLHRLKKHNIPYLFFGSLATSRSSFLKKWVIRVLKNLQATHCHCFNPKSTLLAPLAKEAHLKVLYMETGLPAQDRWWAPLFPHLSSIDQLIAISQMSKDHFYSLFQYQGPSTIVYSLIDTPPAHLARKNKAKELHIVYFGRIYHQKGVHVLLEAFRELLLHFPSSQLTFIGEGPDEKGLQQNAFGWNIQKNVHFVGFKTKESLFEQLTGFNLFCLPSFTEGSPCSILEAMSMGLPILASSVGGIPELIEDGRSGLLVPPKDPKSLFDALLQLAKDPDLRETLGQNGLKRYQNTFAKQPNLLQLY